MADPGGWSSTQDNEFSSFQSNDSFNLNEVTGIDGMLHIMFIELNFSLCFKRHISKYLVFSYF